MLYTETMNVELTFKFHLQLSEGWELMSQRENWHPVSNTICRNWLPGPSPAAAAAVHVCISAGYWGASQSSARHPYLR